MKPIQPDINSCFDLLPVIVRARGFRLYDRGGNRYLDLYRNNGQNIFGFRPKGLVGRLKNTLEKGLGAELPSVYYNRVIKELTALFPGYASIMIFPSHTFAMDMLSVYFKMKIGLSDIGDPLIEPVPNNTRISYWRPFSPKNLETEAIIPILPFGFGQQVTVVCLKKTIKNTFSLPVSPFVLTGLLHSIFFLKKFNIPTEIFSDFPIETGYFVRKGIYYVFRKNAEEYRSVFKIFLEAQILIAPTPSIPCILPLEFSDGEQNKLCALFKSNIF